MKQVSKLFNRIANWEYGQGVAHSPSLFIDQAQVKLDLSHQEAKALYRKWLAKALERS